MMPRWATTVGAVIGAFFVAMAIMVGTPKSAEATPYFYDHFNNYGHDTRIADPIANPGTPWISTSNPANADDSRIDNGRLKMSADNKEDVARPLGVSLAPGSGHVVYFSFTIRVAIDTNFFPPLGMPLKDGFNDPPHYDGGYFAHLSDNTNGFRARVLTVIDDAAPGFYRIGISNTSNKNSAPAFPAGPGPQDIPDVVFPRDLAPHTTYTVVVKYDVDTVTTTLWINPAEEGASSVTAADANQGTITVTRMAFRQADYIGLFHVDNVRVGSTFADVTTPYLNVTHLGPSDVFMHDGATDVHVATFELDYAPGSTAAFSGLEFSATGSGDDLAHLTAVKVVLDVNTNNAYDPGIDIILAAATFDADDGRFSFNPGFQFAGGNTIRLLVFYSLDTAANGVVNGLTFTPYLHDIIATNAITDGLPCAGSTLEIRDVVTFTAQNPPDAIVEPGSPNVLAGAFDVTLSGGTSNLTALTLQFNGTGDPSQITALRLLHDDGNGQPDAADTELGSGTFSSGTLSVNFGTPLALTAGQPARLWVQFTLSSQAPDHDTFSAAIQAATVTNAAEVTGIPVAGIIVTALRPGTLGSSKGCGTIPTITITGSDTTASLSMISFLFVIVMLALLARHRRR